jgi:Glucose/sorbosone dehydrogenases
MTASSRKRLARRRTLLSSFAGAALTLTALVAAPAPHAHVAAAQSAPAGIDLTRFTRKVLVEGLNEPIQLEFDRRGRVWWIERGGNLRRLDESTGKVALIGKIPIALVGEAGLIGLLLDRDFERSRHLYVYYSAPGDVREMHLSRFTVNAKDSLDLRSEIIMMRGRTRSRRTWAAA